LGTEQISSNCHHIVNFRRPSGQEGKKTVLILLVIDYQVVSWTAKDKQLFFEIRW
jgi:hypothetical protein